MAEFVSKKMKRKEFEDIYDDFTEFSLSSPAMKIRRLDAELPPIIEEEEAGIPLDLDPPLVDEKLQSTIGDESLMPVNEERALVLYKPVNASPWGYSDSSSVTLTVNEDLIPGFKNGPFWNRCSSLLKSAEEQSDANDKNVGSSNCLAVVPWVSYQLPSAPAVDHPAETEISEPSAEPMESDDVEYGTMDIEQDVGPATNTSSGGLLQQWHQQHCMSPSLPPNTATTPVMWSW